MKKKGEMFFVVNPLAGKGRTEKLIRPLLQILEKEKIAYDWALTRTPGDGTKLAKIALLSGYKKIIAVGGDGTVQEVAQGIFYSRASLGIIPGGVGNDFARALGIPFGDILKALQIILTGRTLDIDLGQVRFGKERRYFVNVLGLGIDAKAAVLAQSNREIPADLSYAFGILRELFRFKGEKVSLEIGDWKYQTKALGIIVANGRAEGKLFKVSPSARFNDNLFNISLIGSIPRFLVPIRFLYASLAIFGLLEKYQSLLPKIYYQKASKIKITIPSGWIFHLDGNIVEPSGVSEVEIEILPKALKVIAGFCPEILERKRVEMLQKVIKAPTKERA